MIGKHGERLFVIPCEKHGNEIIPVTAHTATRQQNKFRLKTGRFVYK